MSQANNTTFVSNERLAQALLEKGYLSEEQLKFALKDTRRNGTQHLGQYLIQNKWVEMTIIVQEMNALKDTTQHKNETQQHEPQKKSYKSTINKPHQNASISLPGPGEQFDNYTIIREIARGGMGVVYLAQDVSKRNFALKILFGTSAKKQDHVRFIREGKAISMLDNPNIVKVYAMKQNSGYRFFTMDYIEGETFANTIESEIGLRDLMRILVKISRALGAAHDKKIIHRDIKPSNILMDKENEPFLTDFGLAKIAGDKTMTKSGATLGTPQYMAPEQALGDNRNVDHRTDLYALGVILYKCLTKKLPFQSDTLISLYKKIALDSPVSPRQINNKIPKYLEDVCLHALSKEKKNRYQSAYQFARDLDLYLKNRHTKSKIKYRSNNWKRWLQKHSMKIYGIVGIIILSFAFNSVFFPEKEAKKSLEYQQALIIYKKARLHAEEGELKKAISLCKKALEIDQYFTLGYIEYAKILTQLKKYFAAHKILDKALNVTPEKKRDIQIQKTKTYMAEEEFIKALKTIDQVIAKNSFYVPSLRLRASVYKKLGKEHQAEKDNEEANRKEKSNNIDMIQVENFISENNYVAALSELEKFEATHGLSEKLLFFHSEISYKQKKWDSALSYISQAIIKDPLTKNYLQKAKIFFAAGYYDNAQQVIYSLTATSIHEKYQTQYYSLKGRLALQRKDYAQAYTDYRKVLKTSPSAENYMYCGEAAYYLQQYSTSLKYLDKALFKKSMFNTINARCHMFRGIVYRAIGEYAKALKEFKKAVNKNERLYLATVYLAATYIDLGKYKTGFLHLQKAEKEVKTPLLYEYFAKYYIQNNNIEAALEKLELCLKITPWEGRYYYLYGTALVKLQKYKKAEKYFIRSLELNPGELKAFTPLLINLMDQGTLEQTILVPGYYNAYTAYFWSKGEPDDLFRDQYHALNLQYQVQNNKKKNINYEKFINILNNQKQKKLHSITINVLSDHFENKKLRSLIAKKSKLSNSNVWEKLQEKMNKQQHKSEKNYIRRLVVRLLIGRDKKTFKLLDQKKLQTEKYLQEILIADKENMLMRFLACRTFLALGTPSGYSIVQAYVSEYENTDISILASVALKEKSFYINENILIKGLKNENPLLRSLCVQNITISRFLIPILEDRDERVKVYAAKQLLKSVGKESIRNRCYNILSDATKSENPFVKIYACVALWPKKIIRGAAPTQNKEFIQKYQHTLVRCIKDKHPMVKKVAATRIGTYSMKKLSRYLEKLTYENDSPARYQALISLGWMSKNVNLIRDISANPNESLLMRSAMIPVLNKNQNQGLPFELEDLIKEKNQEAARFVMSFIGIIARQFGPFILRPYLDNKNEKIRASATCGLIFNGSSAIIPKLKEQIKGKSKKISILSYATLVSIMSREQPNKLNIFHKKLQKKSTAIKESAAFGYYFDIYYKTLSSTVNGYVESKTIDAYDPYFFDNVFEYLYEKLYLPQYKLAIQNNKTRKNYLWRLSKAIELSPNARYHSERALIYKQEGKWQEAIADMLQVMALVPKEERFYQTLLEFCHKANEHDKILEISKKLVALNPRIPEGWSYQAQILLKRQNYKEALNAYTRAFVLAPNIWVYYVQMGICRYKLGNHEESLRIFLFLSKNIHPNSKEQVLNVILNYAKLKEYDEAIKFLKRKKNVHIRYNDIASYIELKPLLSNPWVQSLKR